jgi:hypothetical protein
VVRLFTSPVTAGAVERRMARSFGPALRVALVLAPFTFALLLVALGVSLLANRAPLLAPRHRAEALVFALEQPPAFAPPMTVEPSAALVSGRFAPGAPPEMALREAMDFDDPQVSEESRRRLGDYDVAVLWLRVPESEGARHWLVVGWMEGADLAVCSFRFAGDDPEISSEQRLWGERLLDRILKPEYFEAGVLPHVRLRAKAGDPLPRFGPGADN